MPLDWNIVRMVLLVAVALVYALYDVFNKREVPGVVAYASIIVGAACIATYSGSVLIVGAISVAVAIAAVGYVLYRSGFLGAGDVFEIVAIALIMPLQPAPLLVAGTQLFAIPFVVSVFIASGYASIILILVYYMVFAKHSALEKGFRVERRKLFTAAGLIAMYLVLIAAIGVFGTVSLAGVVLLMLLAVPSGILMVYEKLVNYRMVALVYPRTMTEGDMIATNLMTEADMKYFSKRSRSFGRLVTSKLMADLRREQRKLPVYRNAAPLAAFIFVGVVISLLFGNLMFLILVH